MSVSLHEHRAGGCAWIVLTGPDREAFGAWGRNAAAGSRRRRPKPGRPCPGCAAHARPGSPGHGAPDHGGILPRQWAERPVLPTGGCRRRPGAAEPPRRPGRRWYPVDLGMVRKSRLFRAEHGAPEYVGRCALLTMIEPDAARHRLGRPPRECVRPDREAPDLDGRSPAGRIARPGRPSFRRPRAAAAHGTYGRRTAVATLPVAVLRRAASLADRWRRWWCRSGRRPCRAVTEAGVGGRLAHTNHGRAHLSAPSPKPTARARPAARCLQCPWRSRPKTRICSGSWKPAARRRPLRPWAGGRGLTTLLTLFRRPDRGEAVIAARGDIRLSRSLADLAEDGAAASRRGFSRIIQFLKKTADRARDS